MDRFSVDNREEKKLINFAFSEDFHDSDPTTSVDTTLGQAMKHLVNFFRTNRRKNQAKRRNLKQTQRLLLSEALEKRQVFASDLLVGHNYTIAEDVNRDFKVTPRDALIVINQLSRAGGSQDLSNVARGTLANMYDVSGDNRVTPLDALRVINRMSRGEAVDELIELRVEPRTAADAPFGTGFNQLTRELVVGVNQPFNLEIQYVDLRNRPGGDLGAFTLYTDVLTSLPNVLEPLVNEVQELSFGNSLQNATGGTITFSLAGTAQTTNVTYDPNTFGAEIIAEALVSLGYDASEISVVGIPEANIPNPPFEFRILYRDLDLAYSDIPNLVATANLTNASNAAVPVTVTPAQIAPRLANGTVNPTAFAFAVDYVSRNFSNRPFYGSAPVASFDSAIGILGTGAIGQLSESFPAAANGARLVEPFDAFSIPVRVRSAITDPNGLKLTLRPPSDPSLEINLYDPNILPPDSPVVPPEMVLVQLETNATSADDGKGELILRTSAVANTQPTISDITDRSVNQGVSTGAIAFTVADAETAVANLVVTGTSSNTTLVPNANVVIGGSGANRTVTVTPAAGQVGTATITVTVSDGSLSSSDTFVLTVTSGTVNTAPTISNIANQTVVQGTATGAIAFTVGDAQTAPANLVVTGTSSNTTLVPNANIVIGGSGANRTVTVTPAAGQVGTATITVSVSDGTLNATDTFVLTVNAPANTAPTISNITDRSVTTGTSTGAIAFTVGDSQTAPANLVVTGTSSNTTLVPNANIVLGGSGANRTVTVTPAAGQVGTATITVSVSDGSLTATDTFVLTVNAPANTAPTISNITDRSVTVGTSTGAVAFTIGDTQTAPANLTVTGTSSNTVLVPTANIVFGGSGANRTVTVTPAAGQVGTATITVAVSDGLLSTTDTFVLTVTPAANTAPTISNIANVTINEDGATDTITFTVGDAQTAAGSLVVSATSSNTTLVPNANIVLGGSGSSRTLTVTPVDNRSGSATITVSVSDGTLSTSDTFVLTVNSVNDAPTGRPATRTVTSGATYTFSAADFPLTDALDSPANTLAAVVISSLPATSQGTLRLNGAAVTVNQVVNVGQLPQLTFTPANNFAGPSTFTFRVRDNGGGDNGGISTDPTARVFTFNVQRFELSSVSGKVFIDYLRNAPAPTRDGMPDPDEPVIGGVEVRLSSIASANASGSPVAISRFTDREGNYEFTGLVPGTYNVKFMSPDTLIQGGLNLGNGNTSAVSATEFQIVIGSEGGVNSEDNNFTPLGRAAGATDTLDIVVLARSSRAATTETAFAVLSASGDQQYFELGAGYEDVQFAEIALNDSRDAALLTILDNDDMVTSLRLTRGQFAIGSGGQTVRVIGAPDDFAIATGSRAALEAEFGDYRDAIDAVHGSTS
jgi:hypothetical protein